MKVKTLSIISLMLLFGTILTAYQLQISAPDYQIQLQNKHVLLNAGEPMIPYFPVKILLPFGMDVSQVRVQLSQPEIQSTRFEPPMARIQQPISLPRVDTTIPNAQIYESNTFWPSEDFRFLGTQMQRGYKLAIINIFPYKYNPISKELLSYTQINITLEGSRNDELKQAQANMLRKDAKALAELKQMIINPETIFSYSQSSLWRNHSPQSRLIDLSSPKSMIVITRENVAAWWDDYVAWRSSKGVSTAVYTTQDIYAVYDGEDNAAKIRAFIQDAYQSWADSSSPLEYVILGGDDEIVPERGAFGQVWDTVDTRMPTDIYYSNLDGDWNANSNNIYGEPDDQVDMLPEIHIGRFPVETQEEFANMFRKIQYYVENRTFSNNISIMFGENLNNNPLTWGGDYKDDVALHIPQNYDLHTMYERDGSYSGSLVWDVINNGANVMNHMGHANFNILLGQGNSSIERLENTEYGFLYTQGCYPAAFDQRTSGDSESVGEHFVSTAGGLFCFIGNTRYGWYMPGGINGASQYFDREFFIGLYNSLDVSLGEALSYSRIQNLNAALQSDVMRWCYYEVVLFGDPSISVKQADATLPLLSLESYHLSDIDGDNDGSFNPGETLRFYPIIKNEAGWGTATNVSVNLSGLPQGSQILGDGLNIATLAGGESSAEGLYISFQLPQTLTYGEFNFKVNIDAQHSQSGASIGSRSFDASFEITLIDNRFPWDCINGSHSSPIVYDFDDDGHLDILYQDVFGEVYLIDKSGQQFGGFAFDEPHNMMRSSAFGDVDGDSLPELVIASRTGNLTAVKSNGEIIFEYDSESSFLFTPVLADLTADQNLEIISMSFDKKLHALNGNGELLPGFPVSFASVNTSELAAADLNGDGHFEIVLGTRDGFLHVIDYQGNPLPGFPVDLGAQTNGAPLILENNRIAIGAGTNMVLVEPSGEIVFSKPLVSSIQIGAVAADFDNDGSSDLVFTTINNHLYLMDQQGNCFDGFPVNVGSTFSAPPLIADLTGDNFPDILLQSYMSSVYAYDRRGNVLPGFPFHTIFNGNTPGTLTDLDGNGNMSLISGYSTGVVVINLRLPIRAKMPWTTYRGSLLRQGSIASTGYVSSDTPQTPQPKTALRQNYPNPFNPSTTISFSVGKKSQVSLNIYNLKGQLVQKLINEELGEGEYSLQWNGLDFKQRPLASGMYFYRLQTPELSITKRMLLMK